MVRSLNFERFSPLRRLGFLPEFHFIRDINDGLWKAPFGKELETFAVAVQSLLVPILEEVDRYGLKAWHLRKFPKDVERLISRIVSGSYIIDA